MNHLRQMGIGAVTLVAFAPLFALAPFHFGTFYQSEPVNLALTSAGLLGCLCIVVLGRGSDKQSNGLPLVAVVSAAIALVTLVLAPLAPFPVRAWLGSMEFHDGGASYLLLAVFLSLGYRLFEVGAPLRAGPDVISWINKMFESNCLFMHRALFDRLGDLGGCLFDLFFIIDIGQQNGKLIATQPGDGIGVAQGAAQAHGHLLQQ